MKRKHLMFAMSIIFIIIYSPFAFCENNILAPNQKKYQNTTLELTFDYNPSMQCIFSSKEPTQFDVILIRSQSDINFNICMLKASLKCLGEISLWLPFFHDDVLYNLKSDLAVMDDDGFIKVIILMESKEKDGYYTKTYNFTKRNIIAFINQCDNLRYQVMN